MQRLIFTILAWGTFVTVYSQSLQELVLRHAPQIRHHSEENYLPSSVEWFLNRSAIVKKNGLFPEIIALSVSDETILNYNQVDLAVSRKVNEAKYGNKDIAKCYVHIQRARYQDYPYFSDDLEIQYWFFYPWNGDQKGGPIFSHEGDWEGIRLIVDHEGEIKYLYRSHHGAWTRHTPDEVLFHGTHPVFYSANESHALYTSIGRHRFYAFDDTDNHGWHFNTWESGNLEVVEVGNRYQGYAEWPSRNKAYITDHDLEPTNPNWLNFIGKWGIDGPHHPKRDQRLWKGINWVEFHGVEFEYIPDYADYLINEPYPSTLINGPSHVCSGGYSNYFVSNASSQQVRWNSTNPQLIDSQNINQAINIRARSNQSKGSNTLEAVVTYDYGLYKITHEIEKEIYVGAPRNIAGTGIFGPGVLPQQQVGTFTAPGTEGTQSHIWNTPSDWNFITGHNSPFVQFKAGNVMGARTITYRAQNRCGYIQASKVVTVMEGNADDNPIKWDQFRNDGINELAEYEDPISARDNHSASSEMEWRIHPNPTQARINLRFYGSGETQHRYQVMDLKGNVYLEGSTNLQNKELDLSQLSDGVYLIVHRFGDLTESKKIVLQR